MGIIPAARTCEVTVARAPELGLVPGGADVDLPADERAVADLLAAPGQDLDDEHLRDTPHRVAATVQATGSRTVTSSLHGLLRDDPGSRAEFLALAGIRT